MSENHYPSCASLTAIWALEDRIRREDPRFRVLDMLKYPRPRLTVKDTAHNIIVAFSSEAEYLAYCHVTARQEA